MAEFENNSAIALKAQLGRNLPEGITAEVDVYYKVASPYFGTCHCKTPEQAITLKADFDKAAKVFEMLPQAIDRDGKFANGGGYVQHPVEAVAAFVEAVRGLIVEYYRPSDHEISKSQVLSDFDRKPQLPGLLKIFHDKDSLLGTVYERLCCIDEQGREWGQASYALKSCPHWNLRTDEEWKQVA